MSIIRSRRGNRPSRPGKYWRKKDNHRCARTGVPKHRPKNKGTKKKPRVDADGYPKQWTEELKESIRSRQGYRCAWCGARQDDVQTKLHVHHKSGDKTDCRPKNLIALCPDCHTLIAHGGKYSKLEGPEKDMAIEKQKSLVADWKSRTPEQKAEEDKTNEERELERRARDMGLSAF